MKSKENLFTGRLLDPIRNRFISNKRDTDPRVLTLSYFLKSEQGELWTKGKVEKDTDGELIVFLPDGMDKNRMSKGGIRNALGLKSLSANEDQSIGTVSVAPTGNLIVTAEDVAANGNSFPVSTMPQQDFSENIRDTVLPIVPRNPLGARKPAVEPQQKTINPIPSKIFGVDKKIVYGAVAVIALAIIIKILK